jgi:hypothetical protein
MSNPVSESIISWQSDAAVADTNLPVGGSNAGVGQSQDLSGNLRLLKSEMRGLSINASWERWRGVKNLAGTANIAFTYISPTQFSVNDDFTSANRLVAVVGRRVKALMNGYPTIYGTITAASAVGSTTTVTILGLGGTGINNALYEMQFGPELRAVGSQPIVYLQNKSGIDLGPGFIVVASGAFQSAVQLVDQIRSVRALLVAREFTQVDAFGEFITHGLVSLYANAVVIAGHYLITAGAGAATAIDSGVEQGDPAPQGAFALALASFISGTGLIPALLYGSTVGAPVSTDPTSNGYGTRTVSAIGPSGGSEGDIHYQF